MNKLKLYLDKDINNMLTIINTPLFINYDELIKKRLLLYNDY